MLVPRIYNYFADDFFDDMFPMPFSFQPVKSGAGFMNTDVKEFDDRFELALELPGYKKEDIHATLKNGYLTIQAERKEEKDEKDKDGKFIRRERYSGSCKRSFYVGKEVTEADVRASFEDGVLKLGIPKIEKKPAIEEKKVIQIQ